MTPWLSFWTSPLLVSNNTEKYLLVCTINGIEKLPTASLNHQVESWQEHCSALLLAEALSHSAPPTLEQFHLQKLISVTRATPSFYYYTVPHTSSYISRAPPIIESKNSTT